MYANFLEALTSKRQMLSIISLVMCAVLMMSMFLFVNVDTAYCRGGNTNSSNNNSGTTAAGDNIQNAVNDGAQEVIRVMRAIVTPICIILIAFAGFQFLIGGQQGTEKARKTLMAAALGIAVVLLAPLFGQALATWFANASSGNLSDYNPLANETIAPTTGN